jgi:tRNA dimethylallyltransferase
MHASGLPPAIFLMGPTASGKTALAVALAAELPVELVSVDAAQVYRGLDIGTAKPSLEERARVPQRLIDIRDPGEAYSAADFRADALQAMGEITAAGRIPLLVGGTLFYFRALERGLPPLPSADPGLRAQLLREAEEQGWDRMHARLRALDPARAARIHPHDPQRLLRALEIIALTGRAASAYGMHGEGQLPYRLAKLVLYPQDRDWLHRRIAERFDAMLAAGFLEEARALFARPGLAPELPALRTVGYRQAGLYLTGQINYDRFVQTALAATRQLAKRQLTWLRAETDSLRLDCSGAGDLLAAARAVLFARLSI